MIEREPKYLIPNARGQVSLRGLTDDENRVFVGRVGPGGVITLTPQPDLLSPMLLAAVMASIEFRRQRERARRPKPGTARVTRGESLEPGVSG